MTEDQSITDFPPAEDVVRICEEAAADESRYAFSNYDDAAEVFMWIARTYPSLLDALQAERSSRERAERIIQDVTDVAEDFSNFAYDDLPGAVRIMAAIIRSLPTDPSNG